MRSHAHTDTSLIKSAGGEEGEEVRLEAEEARKERRSD
jgi:hypothetical protein